MSRAQRELEAIGRDQRQVEAITWVRRTFGRDTLQQRALRFLEESIEAYQSAGGKEEQAHRLLAHVFARTAGELGQELGGVGVTLLALAAEAGLSADEQELLELARAQAFNPEHFRKRNAAKDEAGFRADDMGGPAVGR